MEKRQVIITAITFTVLAVATAGSMYFADLKEEPEITKVPVVKKYVKTQSVDYKDISTFVIAYGRVRTAQSLDLLSEVSGRMFEGDVKLKDGQRFTKGTLLFKIDDQEASLNLKSQKSNFLRDIAAILPDFKIDYADNYDAWSKYFSKVSLHRNLPEIPEAKSDKEKTFLATKGIYSTFYAIKSSEARLRKYRYYAPFDGSISEVNQQSGAFINPGTKIGKIMRSGVHELQVSVETKDIPWVIQGSEVEIYSDETQQTWKGQVIRISDFVNQNTQSVDVFIAIEAGETKLYDGQFIQAAIPARTIKDGFIIPRNTLYNGNEVFVVNDTLLKTQTVKVHRTMKENVIISGLPVGSQLVIEPLVNAHNNMVVYRQEEKDINLETGAVTETTTAAKQANEL